MFMKHMLTSLIKTLATQVSSQHRNTKYKYWKLGLNHGCISSHTYEASNTSTTFAGIRGEDSSSNVIQIQTNGSSPQSLMTTFNLGRSPLSVSWDSISLTTSMPSITWPNTTWFLSNHGVCQQSDTKIKFIKENLIWCVWHYGRNIH